MDTTHISGIQSGIRIEVITIIWMVMEMALSIAAGIAAHSLLLTAFGSGGCESKAGAAISKASSRLNTGAPGWWQSAWVY